MRRTALVIAAVLGAACSSDGGTSPEPARTEITVLAAASLTEAFAEIGEAFEAEHEGVTVTFSFGPSDGLAAQIREGAPADLFASASPTWMDDVEENGPGVTGRADFARNRLVLITPADNPAGIDGLGGLAAPGVKLVLAAEDVPVGGYAREVLSNAAISDAAAANVVSNEEDVKAVVQKVLLGEADAGIVYVTDLTDETEPQLNAIEIPDDVNVIATYPIGVIAGSPNADIAQSFIDHVLGDGQETLRAHNFLAPP
jgi:molybdate transport system substrate-binding protein